MTYSDVHLQNTLDFVKNWYGRSLPRDIDSRSFVYFASNSKQFAELLVPKAKMLINAVAESAYTDGKDIYMAGVYFIGEFYKSYGVLPEDYVGASIAVINGVQAHEALHIILSDSSKETSMKRVEHLMSTSEIKSKAFSRIINIVEDVFIENYGVINYPIACRFIPHAHNVMFSQAVRDFVFNSLSTSGVKNISEFIDVLTLAKNDKLAEDSRFDQFSFLTDILNKARNTTLDRNQRARIAVDIYRALEKMSENPINGEQTEEMEKGNQGQTSSSDMQDKINNDGELSKEIANSVVKSLMGGWGIGEGLEDYEREKGTNEKEIKEKKKFLVSSKKQIEELKKQFEIFSYDRENSETSGFSTDVEFQEIVNLPSASYHTPDIIKGELIEWRGFDTHLRQMREIKHTQGRMRDSGAKIVSRQIHRIATDNQFMANMDSDKLKRGKPEIIMLLDMSGSMTMEDKLRDENGKQIRLDTYTARVGYSAYQSLVRAGMSVSVYAHTTKNGNGTFVIGVAANNMPLMGNSIVNSSGVINRFNAIDNINNSNNKDGVAIEFVADRFTSKAGTKILFVLSDGQPASYDYGGKTGIDHTTKVVRDLRKKGIKIVSISLVESVVESNDEIYGADFNIHAYGGRLSRSLQDTFSKLDIH